MTRSAHSDKKIFDAVPTLLEALYGNRKTAESVRPQLVVSNIKRRMRELNLRDFDEYLRRLVSQKDELEVLVSMLTIHTTSWFREKPHFFRIGEILRRSYSDKAPRFLCLGCSTGEEAYSIALVLENLRSQRNIRDYSLQGVDIDRLSVRTALGARYDKSNIVHIPNHLREHVRVDGDHLTFSSAINSRVSFECADLNAHLENISEPFDFIICRNVLIYYSQTQTRNTTRAMTKALNEDGYLIFGHCDPTDTLNGLIRPHGNAIFSMKPNTKPDLPDAGAVRVLFVDDDPGFEELLKECFGGLGFAVDFSSSGSAALKRLNDPSAELPDVIVTDFCMPSMNGIEFARACQSKHPSIPVLMTSGATSPTTAQEAMEAGVLEFLSKPFDLDYLANLCCICKSNAQDLVEFAKRSDSNLPYDVIAIGASTGGPEALAQLLENFPKDGPPIVVVQHIVDDFAKDFAERLGKQSGLQREDISSNPVLRPGHLYVADSDQHVHIELEGRSLRLQSSHSPKVHGHRPSVDVLFNSLARIATARVAAVLLTGMGRDGADGLFNLKMRLSAQTYAQSEESCTVFGMPKAAIELGGAGRVGDLATIRRELISTIERAQRPKKIA